MSRVGKHPIEVPKDVKVNIQPDAITITGPKGSLTERIPPSMEVAQKDGHLLVSCRSAVKSDGAIHGLIRTLIANMVHGVIHGFQKDLLISGMGYRAAKQGNKVTINLGFSHPVTIDPPPGIELSVEGNKIVVRGIYKQLVGQIAANIRGMRPPDPYKGKGISYAGEYLKLKPGKSGGKGATVTK